MSKLKVSIIGTGHLGSIHAKLWNKLNEAELAGIFDIDIEKSKEQAEELDCKYFNSIEETLVASDAVIIAAPTSLHFEIAMKCINSNKHCLIEKPITGTYEEATELIKKADEKEVIIQVGHVERFNPAIAALSNYSIEPLFIEAHRLSNFVPRAIDVSVIHDLMIHDIDIILWMMKSKVTNIVANGVPVLTDTIDIANARITFENGAVANLTASRLSAHPMRKMRLFQKDAYISIDFGQQDVEVFRLLDDSVSESGGAVPATMLGKIDAGLKNKNIVFEKPAVPKLNAIAEEQKAFLEAITNNRKVTVGAPEAAEALRIAEVISSQIS